MDGDVRAWERNVSLGELPIVTRAFLGGAAERETGVGSLSSDFTREGPTLNMTRNV